jgi:hypothetical protein
MLTQRTQQLSSAPTPAVQAGEQQARPDQQGGQGLPAGRARAVQQTDQGQKNKQGGGERQQGRATLGRPGGRAASAFNTVPPSSAAG